MYSSSLILLIANAGLIGFKLLLGGAQEGTEAIKELRIVDENGRTRILLEPNHESGGSIVLFGDGSPGDPLVEMLKIYSTATGGVIILSDCSGTQRCILRSDDPDRPAIELNGASFAITGADHEQLLVMAAGATGAGLSLRDGARPATDGPTPVTRIVPDNRRARLQVRDGKGSLTLSDAEGRIVEVSPKAK